MNLDEDIFCDIMEISVHSISVDLFIDLCDLVIALHDNNSENNKSYIENIFDYVEAEDYLFFLTNFPAHVNMHCKMCKLIKIDLSYDSYIFQTEEHIGIINLFIQNCSGEDFVMKKKLLNLFTVIFSLVDDYIMLLFSEDLIHFIIDLTPACPEKCINLFCIILTKGTNILLEEEKEMITEILISSNYEEMLECDYDLGEEFETNCDYIKKWINEMKSEDSS